MAFTELYCDASTGANVNGGSDAGSPSMSDTAGTGAVSTVTHQYTSVATNGAVAVGQMISIYSGAATVPAFTARITVVTGGSGSVWVITYSTTAVSGTEPTTGSTYKAQVGGAWKGPNAAENHPFGFIAAAMTNASGDAIRVNFKNGTNYAITAAVTHNLTGPVRFEGYTSAVGDGGKAVIDGGTSGASYALFTCSSGNGGRHWKNLIFQNNGATGSASGVSLSATGGEDIIEGCVVNNVRGYGLSIGSPEIQSVECEIYAANQSNTGGLSGFLSNTTMSVFTRCIAHDNTGSNTSGFKFASGAVLINCISESNGQYGVNCADNYIRQFSGCDFYNNVSDGVRLAGSAGFGYVVGFNNCNFVKNGGFGINMTAGNATGTLYKCGFGSGTAANTSGATNGLGKMDISQNVTYAANVTPWVDPDNGDFRITLPAAKGTGRGTYTQTAASYAGTVGYPDIGAAQHIGEISVGINSVDIVAGRRSVVAY